MFIVLIASVVLLTVGCAKKVENNHARRGIVLWHWLSDRTDVFNYLAEQYSKDTGIPIHSEFSVVFELYAPTSAYTSKIRAAAQANKLPDIYGVLMEMRDFASLIKAGHILDITSYVEENNGAWKSIFHKGALLMNTFQEGNQYGVKPGIYGIPIDINNIQLIYNLDLLEKAGWDTSKLPDKWEEFIALGDMLKKAGIPGMVSGWGEPWMIHCMADNFAWNIMGKEKILATIKGDIPYTDPDWVRVLQLFKDMKEHGLLAEGVVTMINKEAEQTFANERAAIAFNGSWCVNIYESMNPDLRYGVALPPRVNLNRPMYIWGGTTSFIINGRSEVKEKAVGFLKWLTDKKQQDYLAIQTRNIPSNKNCSECVKGVIEQFAKGMDNVVHPRFLPIEEYPLVTEAFDKGIQSIIIGEATPEEVAKTVQETKIREAGKAERFKAAMKNK